MQIELSPPEVVALASQWAPDFIDNIREAEGEYLLDLVLARVPAEGPALKLAAALFKTVTLAVRLTTDPEADRRDGVAPRLAATVTVKTVHIPADEVLKQVRVVLVNALRENGLETAAELVILPSDAAQKRGVSLRVLVDMQVVMRTLFPGFSAIRVAYGTAGFTIVTELRAVGA
ncbi:hypothetical protein [Lysinibacter sp. HNR]|uniref:hypothetical protein n=1 Tax=Lysinibacter sp. HNR TaxID=3031408 RepID=UPI00243545FA|nr:hypothetical protein [Lysinibacter sp. HNR]WGD36901.1 hypothetical protein FrondiHNR_10665 [Lysinibacter sp. HNR]